MINLQILLINTVDRCKKRRNNFEAVALPAINDLRILVLEPPEALSEGAFDLAFDGIHFVAGNPLLPLKLGIR